MSTARSTSTEPAQTLQASLLALRSWTARQRLAAVGFSVAFALLIGIPTVLIPNPVFGRQVPLARADPVPYFAISDDPHLSYPPGANEPPWRRP